MKRKIYKLISSGKQGWFVLALTVILSTAYSQTTFTYNFTGAPQVINTAGAYSIECWGANGGDNLAPNTGGKGGYSRGFFTVVSAPFYIYVGGKGLVGLSQQASAPGGYNGGGSAGAYSSATGYAMGSGGGATHVGLASGLLSALASNQSAVVIVAGGGGGSGSNNGGANLINLGGHGGGLSGGNGLSLNVTYGGYGGTQTAGGFGQMGNGTFGQGGNNSGNNTGAGGGGGWYGGGAAQWEGSGGGSGYIGGVTNGTTIVFGQPGYVANPNTTGDGYVILTRLCDLNITASKNPICEGESVVLNSNAGSNILWSNGATSSAITVTPSTTTGYTMSGVSTSSSACTSTVSIMVNVNPLPIISAVSFPAVICVGGNGTLNASGASTYTWSSGATGAAVVINPTVSSVYTATGTSVLGCVNTETVAVTVNTNSLTVSPNTSVCAGSTASLTAGGVIGATWSTGASFPTILVNPVATTLYSVSGQDAFGCTLSNTVSVYVHPLPTVGISANRQTICRGETVTLTATGATSYVWDDNSTTNDVVKTLLVDVPYTYTVTGTDANGCKSTKQITVKGDACTGLVENTTSHINVFPNPINNEVIISTQNNDRKIIVLSDITGKTLLVKETSDTHYKLETVSLPSGVYYLQVTEGEITTIHKVIKQ